MTTSKVSSVEYFGIVAIETDTWGLQDFARKLFVMLVNCYTIIIF